MKWKRAHLVYGEHRLLRYRHDRERQSATRQMKRIQMEVDPALDLPHAGAAAGDAWLLRGIPMVGVKGGVGGAIPGSRPDSAAA